MVVAHDLQESQKTKDIQISRDVTFNTMLLSSNTLEGLKSSGFFRPSPIQLQGIPLGKCGFDLLLEAKSGTGKTAVFTIIALEKLDLDKGLQAVILAPTREIAAQICDVFRQIGCQYKGLCVEVVMGGLPVQEDINKFKGNKVHIVVGSPGRLKHLISDHHMDTSAVRFIVFDEADKLMEKSFLGDIKSIYLALPQAKQVIMSSATYPDNCKEFIKEFVHDAQHIHPSSDCVLLGVVQKVTHVKYSSNSIMQTTNRFKELSKIITTKQFKQCLVFCNYRARVREVYKMLTKAKWPAEQLYGAQDQIDRLEALKILQEYKCRILITTDLAARGIDASNVDLVINFEPPYEWQTYLHRIGRAGRFGSYGMAITILSMGDEQKMFMNLLSAVNLSINVTPLWTEAKTNNSNGAKTVVSEAMDELKFNDFQDLSSSELWKMICDTGNSSDKETIEDFHELVNSFQNTANDTNDVKSFSDLCDSFQNNHLPDTKEIQYKCIKWPNLSTKECLIEMLNKLKDHVQEFNGYPHKLSNYVNQNEEKICTKNTNQTMSIERVQNNLKISNGDIISTSNSLFSNNKSYSKSEEHSVARMRTVKTLVDRKQISSSSSNEELKIVSDKSSSTNSKCGAQPKVRNTQDNIIQTLSSSSQEYCKIVSDKSSSTNSKCGPRPLVRNTLVNKKQSSSSISHLGFKTVREKSNSNDRTQSKVRNTQDNIKQISSNCSQLDSKIVRDKSSSTNSKCGTQPKVRKTLVNGKQYSSSSSNDDFKIVSNKSNSKHRTQTKVRNTQLNKSAGHNNCGTHTSKDTSTSKTQVRHTKEYQSKYSYYGWYKQLKTRVSQIELTIYNEELSKL